MFAQGFQELVDERERLVLDQDPVVALKQRCKHFIEFVSPTLSALSSWCTTST